MALYHDGNQPAKTCLLLLLGTSCSNGKHAQLWISHTPLQLYVAGVLQFPMSDFATGACETCKLVAFWLQAAFQGPLQL